MIKDLTVGKPIKVIVLFALPMLAGNVFQLLYNTVDSIIVGNFLGSQVLASVGAAFPINFLMISITMGLATGCSVVVSQFFGAERIEDIKRAVFTAFIFSIGSGIIFSILFVLISPYLLMLLKTPKDIIGDSIIYLKIMFSGMIFFFICNMCTSILRALGDSKIPFYFLAFSSLLNIALDLIFVIIFKWGVEGVAIATIISQALAAIFCAIYMFCSVPVLKLNKEDTVFDIKLLKKMLKYAIPITIQQLLLCFRFMVIQGLINSFGSVIVAGYTVSGKIETLAIMPIVNVGMALSMYTAQNVGAEKIDRIREGFVATIKMAIGITLFIAAIIFLFGHNLVELFLNDQAPMGVSIFAIKYLSIISSVYIIDAVMTTSNSILRGAGDMKFFMISSIAILVSKIVSAYALAPIIGALAIAWSNPISWLIGGSISLVRYFNGKWQKKASAVLTQK